MTALPALSEKDFLVQVTQLATRRGWKWMHMSTAMYGDNWRTPYSGPLGKGWPDLVLVRERDHRLMFVELKRDGGVATSEQIDVLGTLSEVGDTALWRPADWPEIERVLR